MTNSQAEKRIRKRIWIQAALIISLGAAPGWPIAALFMVRKGMPFVSAVALVILIFLSFWIALLLVVLFMSRILGGIRMRRIQSIEPSIRRMLAEHADGKDLTEQIRAAYIKQLRVTEEILTRVLSQIVGSSNVRLHQLAEKLGMVERLVKRYRSRKASVRRYAIGCLGLFDDVQVRNMLLRALKDHEGRIRIDASRALVRLGGLAEIMKVFEFMAAQPLLVRALLADDLRPHALVLGESCIPRELSSGESRRILNALEVLGVNPANKEARMLLSDAEELIQRFQVRVEYAQERFDKTFDPWHLVSVSLSRRQAFGTVFGRVNLARRFGLTAAQYEMDVYPKFGKGVYAYLNGGYSDSSIFPKIRAGAELYTGLPKVLNP